MVAKLLALVLPLGLDTFAVAAALGVVGASPRRRLRLSLLLMGFEGGMPLIGLGLGAPLGRAVGNAAGYAAIGLLLGLGLYTLLEREGDEADRRGQLGELQGWGLVALGVSISVDELAIGFTLGLLRLPTVLAVLLIAGQAFVAAQLGLRVGARLRPRLRAATERLAGIVLTGVAAALLGEKLLG